MSVASRSIKTILRFFSSRSPAAYHQLRFSPVSSSSALPSYEISDYDPSASLSSSKKWHPCIPVVLHDTNQVFLLKQHILDHWLFQDLLRKSRSKQCRQQAAGTTPVFHGSAAVFIDCDAILFEFLVWLVENDDPSLRTLDLNDLMEFYGCSESAGGLSSSNFATFSP